jgi:hypothetical protein
MSKRNQHMTARLTAFSMAIALFVGAGSGCIFDTRPANKPKDDGNQIPLDDAIDVFTSMREGLENDVVSNYERAISDDFVFSPLLDDSLDLNFTGPPNAFENWTREVERDVTNLLLSETRSIDLDFTASAEIDENNFVRYRTSYVLTVVGAASDTTIYRGVAFIDVRRSGGVWNVVYWDEIEPEEGFFSWGYLRGTLRQRLQ